MAELGWRLGLYRRLVGARIRAQLQYRLSFVLDLAGAFWISFIDFLAVLVLFSHLTFLRGWSLAEIGFFYGASSICFGLADMLVGHLDTFVATIRDGTFDLVLIRPAGSLFQVIASDLSLRRLGKTLQGAIVFAYALLHLHVVWTPGRLLMLPVMVVAGTVIFIGVWIGVATLAFWSPEMRETMNAFTYGGGFLTTYPINIFGGWLRRLLAFVVPMAFVCYFPGLYILDHPDPLGAPGLLRFAPPLVALITSLVAVTIWRTGVRRYQSTGS